MKTVVIYGSMTGTTEAVAQEIAQGFDGATVFSAADVSVRDLQDVDLLILGASTWGSGDLQDDMEAFLSQFAGWDVSVKSGAVFGLGDQFTYSDTFVDGMADMSDALKGKGIQVVGASSAANYGHSASRAQSGDCFVGLALDQDNESEKTGDRIIAWTKTVKELAGE